MNQHTIKDNFNIVKETLADISVLTSKIADKTLEQLEHEGLFVFPNIIKDTDDLSKDQVILQSVNDNYRSGNVMGFLGVGDERLVIQSRFCSNENDFLFQYLLEQVLDFPNIIDLKTNADENEKLYNLMIFLFPRYLKSAVRKGLFKNYIHRRYNNSNVKGTIDVAGHIRQNTPFVGNIAYSQREYSCDNYLTELICHTIEYIKKKPYGNRVLNKVKDEVQLIMKAASDYSVSDKMKIIYNNKKHVIRHAYYHEYNSLQQLCILILQNHKQQIGSGLRKVYGILFDGAWLWEEYINSLISKAFYHPMNKAQKGMQYLFSGNNGRIYPDFISKNTDNRIIADAKYKPIDNIGNKDYLQVLAYMLRFDAKQGLYIYPESEGADELVLQVNKGSSYEKNVAPREDINIIKYGLKIPNDASDYKIFTDKIKQSEHKIKAMFGIEI